uniref:Uncharacterized protein n=1 Tax=Biomphalaria glabrata TaxID=6526 RepID=A0A2C9KM28_BIOGL
FVEVSLQEFNQSYSKCEQDLLENEGIKLEGYVTFYKDLDDDEHYIMIEKKAKNSTTFLIYNNAFLNKCDDESSSLRCSKDGEMNSYRITMSLNATKDLSQSEWRLAGKCKGIDYWSTPIQLPRILDPSDIVVNLNKEPLSSKTTTYEPNTDELTLCCIEAPLPCIAVITVNLKEQFENPTCVTYTRSKTEKEEFMFGYRVCGNSSSVHKFILVIEPEGTFF